MAIAEFKTGLAWWPVPFRNTWSFDTTTYTIDASTEVCVLVAQPPKTGNIDKFAAIIQAVGNAPDNGLRFSLQGVSATTGLQDGSILSSGNAYATVASGSVTTGWLDPGTFAASYAVTRGGDPIAFVMDFPTFVSGDSVTVRGIAPALGNAITNLPYGISAVSTLQSIRVPMIFAHYDDGTWVSLNDHILPFTGLQTEIGFRNIDAQDEIGAGFILRQMGRLEEIKFWMAIQTSGANFDLVLYDSSNAVVTSKSFDGNRLSMSGSNFGHIDWVLPSAQELTPGSTYRVVLKPTTATDYVRIAYFTPPTPAITLVPGQMADLWLTARADAGAWTNYNNGTDGYRHPIVSFGFSGFNDSAGAGGGLLRHPGMAGGLVA